MNVHRLSNLSIANSAELYDKGFQFPSFAHFGCGEGFDSDRWRATELARGRKKGARLQGGLAPFRFAETSRSRGWTSPRGIKHQY